MDQDFAHMVAASKHGRIVEIKSLLNVASITAAHIRVNAASEEVSIVELVSTAYPYRISDYSPYVLRIPKVSKPKHKPFKFSNFLVYKEGFRDVVDIIWNLNVNGCAMYRVVKRLKGLKTPIRKLLHNHGNLHDRVNRLCVELDEAQKANDCNPSYSLLHGEHAYYLMAFKEASLDEERFLRQKSKIEWLNAGDSNTAYFYKFLGVEGTTTPLDDHGLFFWVLSDHKAECMVREVSDSEIKGALFSIRDDTAHGPDGFTVVFFKKVWDIVGGEVTTPNRDSFSNGKLLKELNNTIISLIPKVYTPARINDNRPKSCCNVLFKCISKIIANRIKGYLKDLVSINQSAFVSGRWISDNILLTQELMRNYHRKRGPPRCAFKVDIHKAYDTVDWGFLRFGVNHKMTNVVPVPPTDPPNTPDRSRVWEIRVEELKRNVWINGEKKAFSHTNLGRRGSIHNLPRITRMIFGIEEIQS
ncbi:sodium/hydrogen exchanger 6 [Tanacetum coccineum]